MKNKEGKEESSKRGTTESEKRTKGWPIKWKRKNLGKIVQKRAKRAFGHFVAFSPFPL